MFQTGVSALAAVILIYVLVSPRTTGLAYRNVVRNFTAALLFFSFIELLEFFDLETLSEPFNVLFSIALVYLLWTTVMALCVREELG